MNKSNLIKLSLTAFSAVALLGLTACGDTTEEGDTTIVAGDPIAADTAEVPAEVVDTESGDTIEIGENGVQATINDGDTTVTADMDGNPSAKITID